MYDIQNYSVAAGPIFLSYFLSFLSFLILSIEFGRKRRLRLARETFATECYQWITRHTENNQTTKQEKLARISVVKREGIG